MTLWEFLNAHILATIIFGAVILFVIIGLIIFLLHKVHKRDWEINLPFLQMRRALGKTLSPESKCAKKSVDNEAIDVDRIITNDLYAPDWKGIFNNSNKVECMFTYARTWRGVLKKELENYSKKENVSFYLFLPNPDNERIMSELSCRFNQNKDTLVHNIRDVKKELSNVFKYCDKNFVWDIKYLDFAPLFHFYLTGKEVVLSLYSHQDTRGDFLTIHEKGKGLIYNHVSTELSSIKNKQK